MPYLLAPMLVKIKKKKVLKLLFLARYLNGVANSRGQPRMMQRATVIDSNQGVQVFQPLQNIHNLKGILIIEG